MRKVALWLALAACAPLGAWAEGQTWAVVVGVDEYVKESIPRLRYACADAKLLSAAMVELLKVPKDNLFVFTSDAVESTQTPTKLNLIYRLDWLRTWVKPEDRLVFYFAGHGANLDSDSFLMTEESDNRSLETLKASALNTKDLAVMLERTPASQTLTILDACRNDPSGQRPAAPGEDKPPTIVVGAGRESAGLLSCSVGQRSWEWDATKHGFFTYYLVEGMRAGALESDGRLTLQGLANYLGDTVNQSTLANVKQAQVPIVYYLGPSMKNWVLANSVPPSKLGKGGQAVANLDAAAARVDQLAAEKAQLLARLRAEEARRQEVELRLQTLEKKYQAGPAPSEQLEKLTVSSELALRELVATRKQLEEAKILLAGRGGPTPEANLMVAESEQLKAENKVLHAKIALLEGKLQQGGVSMARSFSLESDSQAVSQADQAELLAAREPTPENRQLAASRRIQAALPEARQLREYLLELTGLLHNELRRMGLRMQEVEEKNLALETQIELMDNLGQRAQAAKELAEQQMSRDLQLAKIPEREWASLPEAPALQHASQRYRQARLQNVRLLEDLRTLLQVPSFRRQWISRKFYQMNSMPGQGDILDVPVKTGPEMQEGDL